MLRTQRLCPFKGRVHSPNLGSASAGLPRAKGPVVHYWIAGLASVRPQLQHGAARHPEGFAQFGLVCGVLGSFLPFCEVELTANLPVHARV